MLRQIKIFIAEDLYEISGPGLFQPNSLAIHWPTCRNRKPCEAQTLSKEVTHIGRCRAQASYNRAGIWTPSFWTATQDFYKCVRHCRLCCTFVCLCAHNVPVPSYSTANDFAHGFQKNLPILNWAWLQLALFGFALIYWQGVLFLHNPLYKRSLPKFCTAGKLALFCIKRADL